MTHKTISLQAGIVLCNAPGILVDNMPGSHQAVSFFNNILMDKYYDLLKAFVNTLSAIHSLNKFYILGI